MLKFIKNNKLLLATVIVLIIISISIYFIIKKTSDGFVLQDDIDWCKTAQTRYKVNPNVDFGIMKYNDDLINMWNTLDCNNLINMTLQPMPLQPPQTYPTHNYVRGRYFRIEKDTTAVNDSKLLTDTSPNYNKTKAKFLNIGGVLIYDNNGKLINTNPTGGHLLDNNINIDTSPNDRADTVNNCLKIVQYNKNRTLADATRIMPQTDGTLTLYNYLNSMYANITYSSNTLNTYWEYDFGSDVNIAGFEILPRSDRGAITSNFLKVKVFADADTGKTTPLNISDTFNMFPYITRYDTSIPSTFVDTPKENVSYFYIKPLVQLSELQPQPPTTNTIEPTTSTMDPTTQSTMPTTQSTMPTTTIPTTTMPTTTMPTSTMPTTTIPTTTMPTTTMPTTTMPISTMPTTQSTMSSTTKQSSISTMPTSNVPQITTTQLVNVLNNGYGSYLDTDMITSDGISMRNAYKGPSTNIVQTDFSGTSNIYAPYLYYNKGINEQFSGSTHDTGQYNYKIYK